MIIILEYGIDYASVGFNKKRVPFHVINLLVLIALLTKQSVLRVFSPYSETF